MRRGALIVMAVMLGCSVAVGEDTASSNDPRAVILKAIDAQGGRELIEKYTAMVAKISGQTTSTGTPVSFVGAMAEAVPGRFRLEMAFRVMGRNMTVAIAVVDDHVTQTINGRRTQPDKFSETTMLQSQLMQDVTMLTPLIDTDRFKLTRGPGESIGDMETTVVNIQSEGLPDMKLCFDSSTGLLAKVEYMAPTQGSNPALEATTYEDYRPTSGMMIARRQVTTHDGKLYTSITLEDVKLFEKLEDTWFSLK